MRLAVAGTGQIVQELLPHLPEWGWELTAICATPRSKEIGQKLAHQYGSPPLYTDYSTMLEEVDADAVYLGVPNFLHFDMGKQALAVGWNLIVEKPISSNIWETEKLADLARKNQFFLYEAITTIYQPDYAALKEHLPRLGTVKLVNCNFSQYSRRYDAFQCGDVLPVFDPAKSGGALMDLNLYNLHWLVGLFGTPEQVRYHANLERGIDTSGILFLQYPSFQAVSIAAKDCSAPSRYLIQGTEGYLMQESPANQCEKVTLHLNNGQEEIFHTPTQHRMETEFRTFAQQIQRNDLNACYMALAHSLEVSKIQTIARQTAGVHFPADDVYLTAP